MVRVRTVDPALGASPGNTRTPESLTNGFPASPPRSYPLGITDFRPQFQRPNATFLAKLPGALMQQFFQRSYVLLVNDGLFSFNPFSSPFWLNCVMTLGTVWSLLFKRRAVRRAVSPWALAKRIWLRRTSKPFPERRPYFKRSCPSAVNGRTKIGALIPLIPSLF